MGHVLHDWNLQQKLTLLSRAHQALPDGGALIVFDAIIDDERRTNAFGLLMSLKHAHRGARRLRLHRRRLPAWMHEVGFQTTRVEHLAGPDSMVVGIK
jgi:O-methyltransferase domain